MKILLVGGNSSLGKELYQVLSNNYEVVTAGISNCDIYLDLTDSFSYTLFPNDLDVIINSAASFGGMSDNEILDAEIVNVLGTLKLCQAASAIKVKHFVLISSIYSNLDEDSSFYNSYSLSKRHGEELSKYYCRINSLPLTILQPSPIYGVQDLFRKNQPLLYSIIDRAQKGEDFIINGSKDPLRNFIFVDDLTKIILLVIQNRIEGVFSCTHPENISFSQIAKVANSMCENSSKILFNNTFDDIPDKIFINDDKLYKLIDFYPKTSIAEGIKKIINYRNSIK